MDLNKLLDTYDSWAYDDFELSPENDYAKLIALRSNIHEAVLKSKGVTEGQERLLRQLDAQLQEAYLKPSSAKYYKGMVREDAYSNWWSWMDQPSLLSEADLETL